MFKYVYINIGYFNTSPICISFIDIYCLTKWCQNTVQGHAAVTLSNIFRILLTIDQPTCPLPPTSTTTYVRSIVTVVYSLFDHLCYDNS